jgi:hypothetical protein
MGIFDPFPEEGILADGKGMILRQRDGKRVRVKDFQKFNPILFNSTAWLGSIRVVCPANL